MEAASQSTSSFHPPSRHRALVAVRTPGCGARGRRQISERCKCMEKLSCRQRDTECSPRGPKPGVCGARFQHPVRSKSATDHRLVPVDMPLSNKRSLAIHVQVTERWIRYALQFPPPLERQWAHVDSQAIQNGFALFLSQQDQSDLSSTNSNTSPEPRFFKRVTPVPSQ